MQPDGTYQLIEALGSCQVGTVWSAVDAQGRSLTVAVLDAAVAADQRWRDAFASTADSLVQGGATAPRVLYADFSTATPWVACAAGDGPGAEQVFIALGMDYHPAPSGANQSDPDGAGSADGASRSESSAAETSFLQWPTVGLQPVSLPAPGQSRPVSPPPSPVSGPPEPASDKPQPAPDVARSSAPEPPLTADLPQWPTAHPRPPVFDPPVADPPVADSPVAGPPNQAPPLFDPGYPPLRPSEPEPRRRTSLWIAVTVGVVLALAAGAGVYAWQVGGGEPTVRASSSPQPLPDGVPTAAPVNPGIEPPKDGAWPAQWPRFKTTDRLRTLDLDGVGIPVKIPLNWQCSAAGRAQAFAKYTCGESSGTGPATGGELVVRDCPQPCGAQEQTEMRQAEEAWGLQWVRVGEYAYLAESSRLEIDGQQRYGLIVVAFWRSGEEGNLDKELVFRGTSTVGGAGLLRRVVNYIRDVAVF
jgi:hypothetical protein